MKQTGKTHRTQLAQDSTRSARAVAYVRVSSPPQETGSESLSAQKDVIEAYASRRSISLIAVFVEVISASQVPLTSRPELVAALEQARSTDSALIVARPSRLTRRVSDITGIYEFSVPIHVANQTGGRVSLKRMKKLIQPAEKEATNKSLAQSAVVSAKRKKSPGTNEGRQQGRDTLSARRLDDIWRVRDVALSTPGFLQMPRKRQVEILNTSGVPRLSSHRQCTPWTVRSLKDLLVDVRSDVELQLDDANWGQTGDWLELPEAW